MNLNILSDDCPSHSSIVAKIAKGDLWLDGYNIPIIAVAYSNCVEGYGILRNTKESKIGLKSFLETNVFPDLKKRGKAVF